MIRRWPGTAQATSLTPLTRETGTLMETRKHRPTLNCKSIKNTFSSDKRMLKRCQNTLNKQETKTNQPYRMPLRKLETTNEQTHPSA